jgi:hypothetical protein
VSARELKGPGLWICELGLILFEKKYDEDRGGSGGHSERKRRRQSEGQERRKI